jgi:hypothetical protein
VRLLLRVIRFRASEEEWRILEKYAESVGKVPSQILRDFVRSLGRKVAKK